MEGQSLLALASLLKPPRDDDGESDEVRIEGGQERERERERESVCVCACACACACVNCGVCASLCVVCACMCSCVVRGAYVRACEHTCVCMGRVSMRACVFVCVFV